MIRFLILASALLATTSAGCPFAQPKDTPSSADMRRAVLHGPPRGSHIAGSKR